MSPPDVFRWYLLGFLEQYVDVRDCSADELAAFVFGELDRKAGAQPTSRADVETAVAALLEVPT